jgi:hypothetical protein
VLYVGIGILGVCVAGLCLWHLLTYLARKLPAKPRTVRHSPEPPSASQSPKLLPRVRTQAAVAPTSDDPEKLQQACTALEDSLAESYLAQAENWLRKGQPKNAVAALQRICNMCAEKPQALAAQERLQQIGKQIEDNAS